MATAGPNPPGTGADDAAVGTIAWSDPGNITTADDAYAVATSISAFTSHYLWATNYGFTIPAGATINGVTVGIHRLEASTFNDITDNIVRLIKGGSLTGDNKATGDEWPTTEGTATYGGVADLWGATLTADDVNGSTFGVALSAIAAGLGGTASVDHMSITITYTEAAASIGGFVRATSGVLGSGVS